MEPRQSSPVARTTSMTPCAGRHTAPYDATEASRRARDPRGMLRLAKALGAGRQRYCRFLILAALLVVAALVIPPLASAEAIYTHGGPVETEPHVLEIFWGSNWQLSEYLWKGRSEGGISEERVLNPKAERIRVERTYEQIPGSHWEGILTQYWQPEEANLWSSTEATTFKSIPRPCPLALITIRRLPPHTVSTRRRSKKRSKKRSKPAKDTGLGRNRLQKSTSTTSS